MALVLMMLNATPKQSTQSFIPAVLPEAPPLLAEQEQEPKPTRVAVDQTAPPSNPYANPMPYGPPPGLLNASGEAAALPPPDDVLFKGTGETDMGQRFYTIPDRSLAGRIPMPRPTPKDPALAVMFSDNNLLDPELTTMQEYFN